jgi:hypothetical protein
VWASSPETELPRSRSKCKALQERGVLASSSGVKVRDSGPDSHELDVHVQAIADAHDVSKEPSVVIYAIGHGLRVEPDGHPRREEALSRRGRLRAVALRPEVDLRGVDLDEPNALTVPQRDRVAIADVLDPIDGRWLGRPGRWDEANGRSRGQEGEDYADSQAIPSWSRSSPRLYDIAMRYSRSLRTNVVTGLPVVRSLACALPIPCRYFLLRLVQFL